MLGDYVGIALVDGAVELPVTGRHRRMTEGAVEYRPQGAVRVASIVPSDLLFGERNRYSSEVAQAVGDGTVSAQRRSISQPGPADPESPSAFVHPAETGG
jgi:hypothetical protein